MTKFIDLTENLLINVDLIESVSHDDESGELIMASGEHHELSAEEALELVRRLNALDSGLPKIGT